MLRIIINNSRTNISSSRRYYGCVLSTLFPEQHKANTNASMMTRNFHSASTCHYTIVNTTPVEKSNNNNNSIPAADAATNNNNKEVHDHDDDPNKEVPTPTTQDQMDKILVSSVCIQAKKIATSVEEQRKKTTNNNDASSTQQQQDAMIQTANALLTLTSNHEFFQKAALLSSQQTQQRTDDDDNDDVVASLHHAFFVVTDWLCSELMAVTTNESSSHHNNTMMLLTLVLQLNERASRDLKLPPMSIPLYRSIAQMIARHVKKSSLELRMVSWEFLQSVLVSSQVHDNVVVVDIFSDALKELVQRNLFADAVWIFQLMETTTTQSSSSEQQQQQHHVIMMDAQLSLELLTLLDQKVDQALDDNETDDEKIEFDIGSLESILDLVNLCKEDFIDMELEDLGLGYHKMEEEALLVVEEDDDDEEAEEKIILKGIEEDIINIQGRMTKEEIKALQDLAESVTTTDSMEVISLANSILEKMFDLVKRVKKDAAMQRRDMEEEERQQAAADDDDDAAMMRPTMPRGIGVKVSLDPSSGGIANVEFIESSDNDDSPPPPPALLLSDADKKKYRDMHRELFDEVIYRRTSSTWEIPDILVQMEQLNGGKEILYSPEYERRLIREMAADDDDFADDIDFFDDSIDTPNR